MRTIQGITVLLFPELAWVWSALQIISLQILQVSTVSEIPLYFQCNFAVIHCKQWITALNLGAFFEQQFLLNVVCIFCSLELAFFAFLTRMVYNLKVLDFAV